MGTAAAVTGTSGDGAGLWSRRGASHLSCAHRGASARCPENTLPAVEAAIGRADYVEVDVRVTADGAVVVLHDPTPERTTDVARRWPQRRTDPVEAFDLRELRRLDAGSWFGEGFAGVAVPVLQEVLEAVAGTSCGVLLEVKGRTPAAASPDVITRAVTDFRRGHPDCHVALGSVRPDVARVLAASGSGVPVGVLFVDQDQLTPDQLADHASFASFLGFRNDQLTAETVARVHDAGLQASHNTNTRTAIAASLAAGADATMSDEPGVVADVAAGQPVTVIEAEDLVPTAQGTAAVRLAEAKVPYKYSGRAAAVVVAAAGERAVFPLGEVPAGPLTCRVGTGPSGAGFTLALDDGPAVGVDSSSRSPARREVTVDEVAGAGEHRLVIERVSTGARAGADTAELVIDTVEVRGAPAG